MMKVIYVAAVLTIATLFGAPPTASAQGRTAASANDAQDLVISEGSNRYVILRDFQFDAVLDLETGLIWERNPHQATLPWDAAQISAGKGWQAGAAAGVSRPWKS